MIRLIGLAGLARCGKSSMAGFLAEKLGFKQYALASPIKERVNGMFGWDERHSEGELKEKVCPKWGFSPRRAYQLFGTEFGRALRPDMWLHMAKLFLTNLPEDKGMIVTDVRFPNEHQWISNNGGVIVHIRRAGTEHDIEDTGHASEQGLKHMSMDWVTPYCENLEQLEDHADKLVSFIKTAKSSDVAISPKMPTFQDVYGEDLRYA